MKALRVFPGRDVKVFSALALARTGNIARAQALTEELEKAYPTDTVLKFYWLPTIHAAMELNRNNPLRALQHLEAATAYEMGCVLPGTQLASVYPAYVRGQAYLLLHNGPAAVAEFQKLVDHPSIVLNLVTGSLAHLQIARAYSIAGDITKAKAAYQDFLALWKDADLDIPILKQAKAEYARLQ